MESNLHKLIAVLILLLPPLFKHFDWERFEVTDCNQSVTDEQSYSIKHIKRPRNYNFAYNNSNKRKLTIEQIRSNKTFANISDTEAQEISDALLNISILTYNIYKNGTGKL